MGSTKESKYGMSIADALEGPAASLASLFDKTELSDCIIKCKRTQWFAHKFVLCTQSPFFDKALKGKFREAQDAVVDLSEEDVDAVDFMLRHMYGCMWRDWGDISELDIVELYSIGRRLSVKNLAELTVKYLKWLSEECDLGMNTTKEMIKIVYTEATDVDELDRQARDALVNWVVKDYFSDNPYAREWYQGLLAVSSAFAFDFALKISKRDRGFYEMPKSV